MMGQQSSGQGRFFYSFDLDSHIPRNHLLRGIDKTIDFLADWVRTTHDLSVTGKWWSLLSMLL
jgi:hypothetical protein